MKEKKEMQKKNPEKADVKEISLEGKLLQKKLEEVLLIIHKEKDDSINHPIQSEKNISSQKNGEPTKKPDDSSSKKMKFLNRFFDKKMKKISSFKKNEDGKKDETKNYSNKELMEKKKKKDKIIVSRYEHKRHLKDYLEKAGYTVNDETRISKKVNIFLIFLVGILTIYLIYGGIIREDKISFVLIQIALTWAIVLPSLIVACWVIFYFVIDFKIYNRRKELEEVLPDFLQLTSANINAGMPLDQAMWFAVRPRFGILAKEIEEVAKSTLTGEDLGDALLHFSKKYDSQMLKRTVNLMLEGLDAGGEIGPLLNKISVDIQETRLIKKDMAANVTTYVIFISFATLLAAPFLFALSNQLLSIIQSLISHINVPQQAQSGSMISLSFSKDAISMNNFKIFAICTLIMTSFFSAVIISTIRYGNVREGIKYIPLFIAVSVTIYLIASAMLGYFLGGII